MEQNQNIKSLEKLNSLIKFCAENPELYFWQALRNWAQKENAEIAFILTAETADIDQNNNYKWYGVRDTYYND